MEAIMLFLIGTLAGLTGSVVGIGGGFIIVPILTFLYHLEPRFLAGTSMAVLFINSLSSTLAYIRQRKVDFASGLWFGLTMIPGSILGAMASKGVPARIFYISFGLLLLAVSFFLLFKTRFQAKHILPPTVTRVMRLPDGETVTYSYHRGLALVISFITGFLSSLLGIGGGSIMVPSMVLLMSFPPHIATATSMFIILVSSLIGTGAHLLLHHVMGKLVIFLALGAFCGGQLGARIAARLPAQVLLRTLAVIMILVSLRLMTE